MSIYIEKEIAAGIDRVWSLTQVPALHARWDLRFSRITYLPRSSEQEPQRFEYETRLGLGIRIQGTGTTLAEKNLPHGERVSALAFGSEHPLSLIRAGSGYWKYVPTATGTRFITAYDYQVRWGWFGWLLDRAIFRPLMAWATAWSFDRLAHWAEQGDSPEGLLRSTAAFWIARSALALVWMYQGLVPKVLGPHPMEVQMCGPWFSRAFETRAVWWCGWAEVLFGLYILWRPRNNWPALVSVILMPIAFVVAALNGTDVLGSPFNVTTVNGMVLALALIVLILRKGVIGAGHCRWQVFHRPASRAPATVGAWNGA